MEAAMTTKNDSSAQTPGEISSLKVLGARLTRLFVGPLVLILITWALASKARGWLSGLSAAFFVVLGITILARWVEQRSGAATTLTGRPATPEQCKRYTLVLLVAAMIAWLAANLVGTYLIA
jgi:hypothetical protein